MICRPLKILGFSLLTKAADKQKRIRRAQCMLGLQNAEEPPEMVEKSPEAAESFNKAQMQNIRRTAAERPSLRDEDEEPPGF